MNIERYVDKNKIKHIVISGEVHSKEEINRFLDSVDDAKKQVLSITFFDANMLPRQIVEKLYSIEKTNACKIYVFKMYLYTYLHTLGINCKYMKVRCIESRQCTKYQDDMIPKDRLIAFLEKLYHIYGYDYTRYQLNCIKRRIKVCMLKESINSFTDFCSAVFEDPNIFDQLFIDFSINVTDFFRDPEVLLAIKKRVLAYLSSYTHIRIWCAGCSNGKEAYSIAILLDELGLLDRAQIYATDINPYVIEEAKNGLYSIQNIDQDILNYKHAGGERSFMSYFELKGDYIKAKDYLGKKILFFQHNLTESGSLNEFELILCRNVMMYFNTELQNNILKSFHCSLNGRGFLVTGKNEGMLLGAGEQYFSFYMQKERIYKAKPT
ncbi:CheR family methyltransferase [Cellulosilyticum sp. I15G10I2]|uniref:CheR family methyltransferase n=1 Tax=Cellulosilyticum sp. I15G10I2 TaxID=1892843 RepID=UPI00085BF333|nr:protein-glutamate O-methyltransferase CheR [Cellulosilyticum sp. I15G10I2]